MSVYDSSVILKCVNNNIEACKVIFSDDNCIIPPTTNEEISYKVRPRDRYLLDKIKEHCTVYTYDDYPFNDIDVQMDINEFVDEIRRNWYNGKPKRGRGAAQHNRLLRYFKRNCIGSKNQKHLLNDYKIYKEANILAEYGLADELVSADHSQTDYWCQEIYGQVMESLPEPFTEQKMIDGVFYKEKLRSSGTESLLPAVSPCTTNCR